MPAAGPHRPNKIVARHLKGDCFGQLGMREVRELRSLGTACSVQGLRVFMYGPLYVAHGGENSGDGRVHRSGGDFLGVPTQEEDLGPCGQGEQFSYPCGHPQSGVAKSPC